MKTVNNETIQPKTECWAYQNGVCQILTEAKLEKLGISVGKKSVLTQKITVSAGTNTAINTRKS